MRYKYTPSPFEASVPVFIVLAIPTVVHSYPITGIYLAVPSEYRQLAFRVGSLACFCFNPMERCENQITAPTSDQLVPAIIRVATARRLTIPGHRSEEHTYELQSLMRSSYAVICLQ